MAVSRRDFGRLVGAAGTAALATTAAAAPAGAAARTWRVSGRSLPGMDDFDSTVGSFMRARDITCGALAVARQGRLLLARGYTWGADPALETQPTSLFRIASISKPVTAAAILRLVRDGRLRLTDPVAGLLGLRMPADRRLEQATVLRLLQHLGGWDRGVSYDPLFHDVEIAAGLGRRLPIGRDDIVEYVTARPLDHAPGTAYAYSNYGYLLLGKIIERVTGTAYADHVRRAVLAPLGIARMRPGRTLVRLPGEMPYFSQYSGATVMDPSGRWVPGPYGTFNHENNAFNGGWLASAVDLVRFARVYDGVTPVLDPASAARAIAPPETGVRHGRYYGCGWHVRPSAGGRTTWHTGSLPGTYALVVRRPDGLTWAVMFDQRDDPSKESYAGIDEDLRSTAEDIDQWPGGDLGGYYF